MSKKFITGSVLAIMAVTSMAICYRHLHRPLKIVPNFISNECEDVKDGRYAQLVERLGIENVRRKNNGKKAPPPNVMECRGPKGEIHIKIDGEDAFASLRSSPKGTEVRVGKEGEIRILVLSENGEADEYSRHYDNISGLTDEPSRPLKSLLPHHSASVGAEMAELLKLAHIP